MRKCLFRLVTALICVVLVCGAVAGCSKQQDYSESVTPSVHSRETDALTEESLEEENSTAISESEKVDSTESREPESDAGTELPKYMTTMQVTKDMGIGINLGNTFEACGDWITGGTVTAYETAWGSPVITKAMIKGYAKEGFKTLRIPVAWSNMMGQNYTINPQLISRVKEVVSWAVECDMYVILNIHWDGGWWANFPTSKEICMNKYKAVWTQLAREFGEFDHRLIFESLNEEGCWDSVWNRYGQSTDGKQKAYGLLNEINQVFVDLIRVSGYNNTDRHLLIAGYATDIDLTCDEAFVMPNDPASRCAVSVHYYTPANYCVLTENASWGAVKTTWGSAEDKAQLIKYMTMLKNRFVDKGVPVIMGEFGVVMDNKTKEDATGFLSAVAETALNNGVCPVLWDITSKYSFYNRNSCSMADYPKLKENFNNLTK